MAVSYCHLTLPHTAPTNTQEVIAHDGCTPALVRMCCLAKRCKLCAKAFVTGFNVAEDDANVFYVVVVLDLRRLRLWSRCITVFIVLVVVT